MPLRIGLVGRDDYKGIGMMTRDYTKHLPVTKHLLIQDRHRPAELRSYPHGLYANRRTYRKHVDCFLRDIDTLVVFEKPYYDIFKLAEQRGIRTIWQVNYEFFPVKIQVKPTMFLCTSSLNAEHVHYKNKVLLPNPIDMGEFEYRPRHHANLFVHNAGTLGWSGANCTAEILAAIPLVQNRHVRFLIHSQKNMPTPVRDRRVEIRIGRTETRRELFREGDVFLLPHKFRAMSLPIDEAMASGMPVLTSDVKPFNEYCEYMFPVHEWTNISGPGRTNRKIRVARIDPVLMARAIDAIAGTELTVASVNARLYAEQNSWTNLLPKYLQLCTG